jgi:integrase/recombinase XerD
MAGAQALSVDAEEFLAFLAVEKGRAANSLRAYRGDLVAYEDFLGTRGVTPREATTALVEDYHAFLRAAGRSPASRARALAAIRGLHRFCLDERGVGSDPTADVAPATVPAGLPKALSEDEVARLLASVSGDTPRELRDRAILEVLYGTGLRISELSGLSIADVDLVRGLLVAFGKGSKERVVPVGRYAREAVAEWLARGRPALAPKRWARREDAESLLLSTRGRRMSRQAVWVVVRECASRAGLAHKVTPHVLRHSCATHMLDHGADIRVVQVLLGHASITTTQVYTRVSQERLRSAYESAHPRAHATRARGSADHGGRAPGGRDAYRLTT